MKKSTVSSERLFQRLMTQLSKNAVLVLVKLCLEVCPVVCDDGLTLSRSYWRRVGGAAQIKERWC